METQHALALYQQWEDFEQLCNAVGDLKTTETTVGDEIAKQLVQIKEFQCPLCHAKVGAECFASGLNQCPQCRFPILMLM